MVGLGGFEPLTSRLSGGRSKPTELQARGSASTHGVLARKPSRGIRRRVPPVRGLAGLVNGWVTLELVLTYLCSPLWR